MAVTVRPATRSDIPALSAVLADAFHDDPVSIWMWPDQSARRRGLSRLFAAETRYHHMAGGGVEVALAEENSIAGATLWDPPGRWKQSTWTTLISMPATVLALGTRLRVGAEVAGTMEAAHPTLPHWYLAVIGTGRDTRGAGYGKALLNSRLERCNAARIPAYLESSNEDNIPYYQRFGFEVTGEIVVPNGGPTLYAMWREPR